MKQKENALNVTDLLKCQEERHIAPDRISRISANATILHHAI